jgi:DHA1 family bicyclomycin/chloramphenicol resistance-like MFS transporter
MSQEHDFRTLAILCALMAAGPISTDLYLPALPAMAGAMHSTPGAMEWTVSGYLIGFSLAQLFWGPVADRYGRRGPLAAGLTLFVIGSAGCALSTTAEGIIGWRVLQAIGSCAGVVLARAMVRDLYAGARAAQMLSTLISVMAAAPLVGPFFGAEILRFASWPWIFWLLAAVGVAILLALLTLPETLPPERRRRDGLGKALRSYWRLSGSRGVVGFGAVGAFLYFGTFAYLAGAPFAFIDYYRLRPEWFGVLFGGGVGGIIVANLVNARLVGRRGIVALLRLGAAIAAAAGCLAAVAAFTGAGGWLGLIAPLFAFIAMGGLIIANSIGGAMASFPKRAGMISALVGAMQYGAGVVGSGLLGLMADGTPRPLGVVMAVGGLGAAVCAFWAVER